MADAAPPPFGLLVIDKPAGPTSHDVVDEVRRLTGERRVGHTGTLDPAASGVLVLCLGAATRLAEYLSAADKRYLARVCFGSVTDTYDAEGQVIATSPERPDRAALERALDAYRGAIRQRPPIFSAVKTAGRPAHRRARAGERVELPERAVSIHRLDLLKTEAAGSAGQGIASALLDVECSAGTYIRSLAHDLGARLGCGAHLASLRRTRSGAFGLEAAIQLETLAEAATRGAWRALLLPPEAGLRHWPERVLDAAEQAALCSGRAIPAYAPPDAPRLWRAHAENGVLVAVAELQPDQGLLRPLKVFGSTRQEREHAS